MRIASIILFMTLIAGCTSTMKMEGVDKGEIRNIDFKSYSLGTPFSVYVGDRVLSRKSYEAVVRKDNLEALNSFTLKGGIATTSISLIGDKGDRFSIAGKNEKGHYVARIPNSIFMFGVNEHGKWDNTVMSSSYWTSPIGSGGQYKIEPEDTLFKVVESTTPVSELGYINHELIFTGVGANGITLLYREYTFENRARSAFTQELVYPKGSKDIRFRNYSLTILSVNPSEISLIVNSE